jgi:beta-galactosidase
MVAPDLPQVHLLPHWNWAGREGQMIEVWAHGNAASVDLRLNGRSLGRKAMPRNGHLVWQVPYAPGTLEAVGHDASGRIVARDRRVTAGAPASVRLTPAPSGWSPMARMWPLCGPRFDRAGNPVPTAGVPLRFALSGPGRVLGTGNGDPTDTTPDHSLTAQL